MRRIAVTIGGIGLLSMAALAGEVAGRKMVWAHYVPWHVPENVSLTAPKYYNFTVYERTEDPRADEVRRALAMGVDGFFMDVVVRNGHTAYHDLRQFLRAAEGTPFQIGLCLDRKTDVDNQVNEVEKLLALNAEHPNFPHWKGLPVVMTYTFRSWTPDEWRQIRKELERRGRKIWLIASIGGGLHAFEADRLAEYTGVFDAAYFFGYSLDTRSYAELNQAAKAVCDRSGALYMPSVSPGYYGGWLDGRNDFYQPYRGLDTIQDKFEGSRAVAHDWLHLTTWNDHDETSLEPRRLSPGCRELVRAYADETKGLPPSAKWADVLFAYHREEFPGTLLRIEAMRLPSQEKGTVTVAGALLDRRGKAVARLEPKTLSTDWTRTEWLVGTTALAATPVLTPAFALTRPDGSRRTVETPSVFLVRPWLQNPDTVRVAMSNCATVKGTLQVKREGDLVRASVSATADHPLKRAILFRNDRPVAEFGSALAPDEGFLTLVGNGPGTWSVEVDGGRIAAAARLFATNAPGTGPFEWDGHRVQSRKQPKWAMAGIRMAVRGNGKITFSSGKEKFSLSPREVLSRKEVSVGKIVFCAEADPCLRECRPGTVPKGVSSLAVWLPNLADTDCFWVRFEGADGTAAATRPIYPFASREDVRTEPIVETATTLEGSTPGSGRPGVSEFLTPSDRLPVKGTRVVQAQVSTLGARRRTFLGGTFDGSGKDRIRLPLRMWPSGPATIEFTLCPAASDGRVQGVIFKSGWMDGISVNIDGKGRLEAVRSGAVGDAGTILKSQAPLAAGKAVRVRIEDSGLELRLFIDGRLDGKAPLAPCRQYGNLSVWLGGDAESGAFFRGSLTDLSIGSYETVNTRR